MDISIRRFGKPREMLGLLQTPPAGKPRRAAFLMFRPFGQEAVRTAPIYRAMSDRLAREGCVVLVFDHHGCGDSPGELDAQSIADWTTDTLAAHAQLSADAPGLRMHWFGMGLGANLAALAAVQAAPTPSCVVLWEPVLDGPAYVERLLGAHRDDLSREMSRSWRDLLRRGEPEAVAPGSLLGFTLGSRLHDELQRTRELPLQVIAARGTRVVMALPDNPPSGRAAYDDVAGLSVQRIETPTNWMSTEASGSAIVPQEIPRTLLATL
jgi:uncharacterized protein